MFHSFGVVKRSERNKSYASSNIDDDDDDEYYYSSNSSNNEFRMLLQDNNDDDNYNKDHINSKEGPSSSSNVLDVHGINTWFACYISWYISFININ